MGEEYDLWHKCFPRLIGANNGQTNVYNRFFFGLAHHLTVKLTAELSRLIQELRMSDANFTKAVEQRRTFAIISHPDAGKPRSLKSCYCWVS